MTQNFTAGQPSDVALIAQHRSGKSRAFEQLVHRYYGMVFTLGYAHLHCRDAADDFTQEVFLRIFLNLDKLENPQYFSTWLTRVARNLAMDWARSKRRVSQVVQIVSAEVERVEEQPSGKPSARDQMENNQQLKQMHDAILRLPAEQREILLLHLNEGLTQQEIGERLEMHYTTVGRHLGRATRTLQRWASELERLPAISGRPNAMKRTAVLLAAVAAMSLEKRSTVAAAVESTAKFSTLAGGSAGVQAAAAAPAAAGAAPGLFAAKLKIVAAVAALAVIATTVSVTSQVIRNHRAGIINTGNVKTVARPSGLYMPPEKPGEELFAGSAKPEFDEIVLRLYRKPDGNLEASYDLPGKGIVGYPLNFTKESGSEVELSAKMAIIINAKRSGDKLEGVLTHLLGRTPEGLGTTCPLVLEKIARPRPIMRDMPIEVPVEKEKLQEYTGTFAGSARMQFFISVQGEQLMMATSYNEPLPLYGSGKDMFFLKVLPHELRFRRDHQGRIISMAVVSGGRETPARKLN